MEMGKLYSQNEVKDVHMEVTGIEDLERDDAKTIIINHFNVEK